MEKLFEAIKASGLTKLTYGGIAAGAALFGAWSLFYAMLGIFIYVNFNTLYKHFMNIEW